MLTDMLAFDKKKPLFCLCDRKEQPVNALKSH